MVTSSRDYLTVEVKPTKKTSPPGSPGKAVRFVQCVKSEPRRLNTEEHWSLYHFEKHARQCYHCYNPLQVFNEGRHMCRTGHDLALDADVFIHMVDGAPCSREKENHKHVRVQLPPEYTQVSQLLETNELKKKRRSSTSRSSEHKPVQAERRSPDGLFERPIITEKPKHTSFPTQLRTPSPVFDDNSSTSSHRREMFNERRGSVYDSDGASPSRGYRVEIREPERKKERRSSGYYR